MQTITTSNPDFGIRQATPDDAGLVLEYMRKLGAYQKMSEHITATAPQIRRLIEESLGEAVFGAYKGETVAFAYFCQKSSAFTGRSGLYIDGFLVDEAIRHQGLGKIMIQYLCKLSLDRGGAYLEWGCMDWNAPTIQFYRSMGAYSLDEMTVFRFSPNRLKANAALFDAGA